MSDTACPARAAKGASLSDKPVSGESRGSYRMAGIIDRYVVREVARTFVGVTIVLMLILVGNQFVRVLTRAASDRLEGAFVSTNMRMAREPRRS